MSTSQDLIYVFDPVTGKVTTQQRNTQTKDTEFTLQNFSDLAELKKLVDEKDKQVQQDKQVKQKLTFTNNTLEVFNQQGGKSKKSSKKNDKKSSKKNDKKSSKKNDKKSSKKNDKKRKY